MKPGEWKYYHKNGRLNAVGEYKNGKCINEWLYYDDKGNLLKKVKY
ncbi:MAG: hypothetical protein ABWZ79_00220 [Pedobacter agri]